MMRRLFMVSAHNAWRPLHGGGKRADDVRKLSVVIVAALIVWLMTILIQRANRRDTLALHAKLDELLRVDRRARSELTTLDEQEPESIEKHRDAEVAAQARP